MLFTTAMQTATHLTNLLDTYMVVKAHLQNLGQQQIDMIIIHMEIMQLILIILVALLKMILLLLGQKHLILQK